MLEKVLADLVLGSIGDYVGKLNSENLKVGLWKGHVELTNLELKRGALCKSGALPYSIKHSVIGRLSLTIPWNSLQTSPVIVSIENVCIVLSKWDPEDVIDVEKEKARLHEAKQAELSRALTELYARKNINFYGIDEKETLSSAGSSQQGGGSDGNDGETFLGKLIMRIVDNVIISISGVHIRYEEELDDDDDDEKESLCSSYGIYFKEFKLTSNETMSTEDVIKRAGSLVELSAYVVPRDKPVEYENTADFIRKMTSLFPRTVKNESPYNTDYVLYPTSGRIEININRKFDEDGSVPRSVGHITLNTIDTSLSDAQIKSLIVLKDSTKLQKLRFHYSRFNRPKESPKKDPKGWWSYALQCVRSYLDKSHCHITPEQITKRKERKEEYIKLFNTDTRTTEETERFLQIEDEISVTEILFYRVLAEKRQEEEHKKIRAAAEAAAAAAASSENEGWMGWFFSRQKKAMRQLNETLVSGMDSEERKVLYSSFDFDYDKSQEKRSHLLFHSFSLTCSGNALYCSLSSDGGKPLCHVSLSRLVFSAAITQHDFKFSMGVGDLLVEDVTAIEQSLSPVSTAMGGTKIAWPSLLPRLNQGATTAISVQYDGSFKTKSSSVKARIQPINIVLRKELISKFLHFIEPVFMTTHNVGILGFHDLAEKRLDINVDFVLDGTKVMIHIGQNEMVVLGVETAKVLLTHGADDRVDLSVRGVHIDVDNTLTGCKSPILYPIDLALDVVRNPLTQGPNEQPHFIISGNLTPVHIAITKYNAMAIFFCVEAGFSLSVQIKSIVDKYKSRKELFLKAKKAKDDDNRDDDLEGSIKSEDIIALSSPTHSKRRNMALNFRLEEIVVDFTEVTAQLAVRGISLGAVRRSYDLQATAVVGAVVLERARKKKKGALSMAIVSGGGESEPFVEARLLVCTPKSPMYRADKVRADVKVGTVTLSLQKAAFTKDLVEKAADFVAFSVSKAKKIQELAQALAESREEACEGGRGLALSLALPKVLVLVDTRFSAEVKDVSLAAKGPSEATILFGEILLLRKDPSKEQVVVLRVKEEKNDRRSIISFERDKAKAKTKVKVRICEISCFYDKLFWSPALVWPITMVLPYVEQAAKKEREDSGEADEPENATQDGPGEGQGREKGEGSEEIEFYVQSFNAIFPGRTEREAAAPPSLDAPERWGKTVRVALGNIFVVFGADPKDAGLRAVRCTLKAGLSFESAKKDVREVVLAPTQVNVGVSLQGPADGVSVSVYTKPVLRITPRAVVGMGKVLAYSLESLKKEMGKKAQGKREKPPKRGKGGDAKLTLSLCVPRFCVKLESKAGCELASLDADGLRLALAKKGPDELTVGLQIEQVFLMDRRDGGSRELIYCKRGGGSGKDDDEKSGGGVGGGDDEDNEEDGGDGKVEEPAGVLVWVSIAPDTRGTRVSLRVGNVGVSVVPDFAYDVISFLESVGTKVRSAFASPAKTERPERPERPERAYDVVIDTQDAGAGVELTLSTGHILVLLTSPESELRCTVCGVHAKYVKQNGNSDLVGLVLEAEVLHSFEMHALGLGRKRGYGALRVTQSLLAPFDVSVKFAQRKGLQPAFFAGVTPLKITFSPQDAFRLFKLFNDAVNSLPKRPKESRPKAPKPRKDANPKLNIIGKIQIDEGINIIMVNKNVPVLKASLSGLPVAVKSDSEQIAVNTNVRLQARFYNATNLTWEPLIERCNFGLQLRCQTTAPQDVSLSVTAKERIELNFTQYLYNELVHSDLLEALKPPPPPPPAPPAPPLSPQGKRNVVQPLAQEHGRMSENIMEYAGLQVYNLTGITVTASYGKATVSLEQAQKAPVRQPLRDSKKRRQGLLRVEFEGFPAKESISLEGSRVSRISLEEDSLATIADLSGGGGLFGVDPAPQVYASVSDFEGGKLITLYSQVVFENCTGLQLSVSVKDRERSTEILLSGKEGADGRLGGVPPHFLGSGHRPIVSVALNAKKAPPTVLSLELNNLKPQTTFAVRNQRFVLNGRVDFDKNLGITFIRFHPPLIVENTLPEDITYKISSKAQRFPTTCGELRRGESCQVYCSDFTKPADFEVGTQDYKSMRPLRLTRDMRRAQIEIQSMNPTSGSIFRIDVDVFTDGSGVRHVVFYSRYWIVNETGLQLFFYDATSDPVPINLHKLSHPILDNEHEGLSSWLRGKEPTTMYSPEYQEDANEKTRISFRTSNSDVSQAFDVDSVGIPREITVSQAGPDSGAKALFSFGVSISFGEHQFYRTRVITVRPRVVLFNKCGDTIRFRQAGTSEGHAMDLVPGAVLPLHLQDSEASRNLVVSILTDDAGTGVITGTESPKRRRGWSRSFSVSDIGNVCLKIPVPGESPRFVWASISLVDVTKVVSFAPCAVDETAYRIANETGYSIMVAQNLGEGKSVPPTVVGPRTTIPYAWDEPTRANRKLLVAVSLDQSPDLANLAPPLPPPSSPSPGSSLSPSPSFASEVGRFPKPLNLDRIGTMKKLLVPNGRGAVLFTATVRLEGATKVLVVSENETRGSGESDSPPSSGLPSRSTSPALGGNAGSASLASREPQFTLSVELDGIGLSVVSAEPSAELLYATLTHVKFVHTSGEKKTTATLVVQRFQVDNQLYVTTYPILIAGRPSKEDEEGRRGERRVRMGAEHISQDPAASDKRTSDMITFSSVKSTTKSSERVDYYQYLALQIGEFDLSLDEALLNHLILFLGLFNSSNNNSSSSNNNNTNGAVSRERKGAGLRSSSSSSSRGGRPRDFLENVREKSSERFEANSKVIYFELLHINPIRCNFSFAPMVEGDDSGRLTNPVRELLGGMSFLSVERAPIALSALLLRNPFYSERQFANVVGRYYRQQLLSQLYKVVFRLDCIGAPLMLWNFCGKGIYDFFYEPSLGMVKGTKDFAHGLGKGTISLVRNTVLGIFTSSRSFLGSLGKGVALLSMDQDYQRGHMLAATKDPRHLGEGLLFGAKDLGAGIIEGVTGMVMEPIKGARQEGFAGFVKGLGLGVVGAAVKPTVGALDMATQAAKGIINSTTGGGGSGGGGGVNSGGDYGDGSNDGVFGRGGGRGGLWGEKCRSRVRHPRHFDSDGVLRPYNPELAEGNTLLCTISKGVYRNDTYVMHCMLDTKRVLKKKTKRAYDDFGYGNDGNEGNEGIGDDEEEEEEEEEKDKREDNRRRFLLITKMHVFVVPEFNSSHSTFTLKPLLTMKVKDIVKVERCRMDSSPFSSSSSIKITLRTYNYENESDEENDNNSNDEDDDEDDEDKDEYKYKEKYEIIKGIPEDRVNTVIAQITYNLKMK